MELAELEIEKENEKCIAMIEKFIMWKRNAPYLYDIMYSHSLLWPSLTVDWLPVKSYNDFSYYKHNLLIGTHSYEPHNNYLHLLKIKTPINEDFSGMEDLAEGEEIEINHQALSEDRFKYK